jgi:hypothetical protein
MTEFIIIELADGLSAVELAPGLKAEEAAVAEGGVLVDEGPFATQEEATDVIDQLEAAEEEEG